MVRKKKKKKKRLRLLELLPANDRLVKLERDEGDHDFVNRGDNISRMDHCENFHLKRNVNVNVIG